ncbi:NAD(P)/FAD-dependent oxidoreductase [Paenibacillus alkaliterrae]|uniref:NAD(P)/FAD-dependent oxidoreductase n=1 Tax=Paenibacillus alkaliterrae TaxID=320909 RepID=UPI001F1D4B28|nr:NAD(P)/FAD-dependent oxidoreductase [Paenibacillus alkaliterrae]MCF2939427.1 NAD(P)/FAD-dependent oxidoreductase [Paenibacillus alkaliterrae]
MERRVDAAVLGAGLAGSCLAKAFADKGWETVLIDRQTFPRHKVCGEFLSPEAQSTMHAFGLTETVAALRPRIIERIRLIFDNGAEVELPLPGAAWGLSRYALDAELHRAAQQAGAQLHTATTVTDVHPSGTGYVIRTKRGGDISTIQARTVVAAWGANPHAGLPGNRQKTSSQKTYMGVKSHFDGITMEPVIEMYFFRGGYLGLCKVEDGHVNAAALLERDAFANAGKSIMSIMEAAAQRNPKLAQRLAAAVPVRDTQAAVAPVHLKRKPLAWDTLPLLGDAAAMIAPLCGDGMSMALRSAAICAPLVDSYLRGNLTLGDWEQQYTRTIQREFNGPLRWGSLLQWLLSMPAVTQLLPGAARLAPGLAHGLVQATRLKPFRSP